MAKSLGFKIFLDMVTAIELELISNSSFNPFDFDSSLDWLN
jgi:hypothetical protein